MYVAMIQMIFLEFVIQLTLSMMIYQKLILRFFAIGVVEDKENIDIWPTTNAVDENFEVRADTAYGGRNNELLYQEVV